MTADDSVRALQRAVEENERSLHQQAEPTEDAAK